MENKRYKWSTRYKSNNTQKNIHNSTKTENIIEVKNNPKLNKCEDKSFDKNLGNSYISISSSQNQLSNKNMGNSYNSANNYDNAKLRKFNSYSAKVKYKTQNNNGSDGFYVTPILNIPKRIIAIKVPQNQIKEELYDEYHIENVTFQITPKKYIYKPYKQPRRKFKLKPQSQYNPNNKYKYNNSYHSNSKRKKY